MTATTSCIYSASIRFVWSEPKRVAYPERRFVTLGLLDGMPVSIVHTENDHEIRVISFRKATKRETRIYFDAVQD